MDHFNTSLPASSCPWAAAANTAGDRCCNGRLRLLIMRALKPIKTSPLIYLAKHLRVIAMFSSKAKSWLKERLVDYAQDLQKKEKRKEKVMERVL